MMLRLSHALALAGAALLLPLGLTTVNGQAERPPADDMKALVAEVRALRLAVEQTSTTNGRAQLLLGRLQLQENRLATLGRQALEARARVHEAQAAQAEAADRLGPVREAAAATTDPNERRALDQQLVSMKHEAARLEARSTQLQQDEAAAYQALTSEQQRWSALNERLEALERTLAPSGR